MRKRKMGWLLGIVFMGMALGITGCREGSREQAPQAEGESENTDQRKEQQQEEGQEESQPSEQTDGEESDSKEQKEQEQAQPDAAVISGRLFSVTMPKELDGLYDAETDEYGDISIYEKTSREEFGGFVFGIFVYEDPEEYAQLPSGHKLGELTDAEGKTYDLVIEYPTDVQFDPEGDAHEKYSRIMDAAQQAAESIIAVDGVYRAGAGMHGEDLYGEVLQKYVIAVREEWDPDKLEQENMSYMYAMRYSGEQEKDPLDVIGYYYCDLTGDGVDELFIGELSEYEEYKGIIYDIYTMVDGEPRHVVSGWDRNRYFITDSGFLCNEGSGGAGLSMWNYYSMMSNSTELLLQVSFRYDDSMNPENPYFVSYSADEENEEFENLEQAEWEERKSLFDQHAQFDYIPLRNAADE